MVKKNRNWIIVSLVIALSLFVRLRLREMPLERDEGEYAYAGQLMLQGIPPYKLAYNMKLPGTYAAYAVIMAIFGQTPAGIHTGLALVNCASIILVFLIGRRILDETAGIVAAVAFGLMSLSPSVLGLAAHATHFVTLFALGGTLALLRAVQSPKSKVQSLKESQPQMDVHPSPTGYGGQADEHGLGTAKDAKYTKADLNAESAKSAEERRVEATGRQTTGEQAEETAKYAKYAEETLHHVSRITHHASRSIIHLSSPIFYTALSGLLFGLAFLMKQHGVFFGVFGFVYLVAVQLGEIRELRELRKKARRRSDSRITHLSRRSIQAKADHALAAPKHPSEGGSSILALVIFSIAFVLPYALTCLTLWAAGVFPQFWFWTVSYASKYASAVPVIYGADVLKTALDVVIGPYSFFWLLAVAGAVWMWWDDRFAREVQGPKSKLQSLVTAKYAKGEKTPNPQLPVLRSAFDEGGSTIHHQPINAESAEEEAEKRGGETAKHAKYAKGDLNAEKPRDSVSSVTSCEASIQPTTLSHQPAPPAEPQKGTKRHETGTQRADSTEAHEGNEGKPTEKPLAIRDTQYAIRRPLKRSDAASAAKPRLMLTLFSACSFASVSIGFHYRNHYFITLLPAIGLLAGLAVSRAIYLLPRAKSLDLFLALPVPLLFVAAIIWSLAGDGALWFATPASEADVAIYKTTAYREAAQIANFIREAESQPRVDTDGHKSLSDLNAESAKDAKLSTTDYTDEHGLGTAKLPSQVPQDRCPKDATASRNVVAKYTNEPLPQKGTKRHENAVEPRMDTDEHGYEATPQKTNANFTEGRGGNEGRTNASEQEGKEAKSSNARAARNTQHATRNTSLVNQKSEIRNLKSDVAVIGSEPEIYFLSHRHSATGYIYTYPLMEYQSMAETMQKQMISEIETNQPDYVIYVNDDLSWLRRPDSLHLIDDWWKQYWDKNLQLIDTITIKEQHTINVMDKTVGVTPATNPDGSTKCFLILKRKR